MKKYLIILLLTFIVLPGIVSAQTSLPDAGLLPDSSLYFLKSWKESIQLFFTFNAENKAKQYLHLAEIRMAEYQKMLKKGKDDIAEKTLTKYQNQLNRALSKVEEIKQKGKDIKDLSSQIEQVASKHLEVLQQNLEKVPETAKKGIENAIKNSQKEIERVLEVKMNKEEINDEEEQEESKVNNETSDWKTYRNEEYGFEFRYPLEMVLSPGLTLRNPLILQLNNKIIISLTIFSLDNSNGEKILEDSKNYLRKNQNLFDDFQMKEIVIGRFPAFKINYTNIVVSDVGGGASYTPVSILQTFNNKYYYSFDCIYNFSKCNQILSTFKFIK